MTLEKDGIRRMQVVGSTRIAPRMQRLRLAGEALEPFDTDANLHVRLHVPVDTTEPGEQELGFATRYYTIRRIDAAAGWVDLDFVLHEAPGPAGDFARSARIGDLCGMSGPCGLGIKPAARYLLAGDETALPAIARITEKLPADTTGIVLIEVDGPEDRLELTAPVGMDCRWIYRRADHVAEGAGFIAQVAQAIAATAAGPKDHFVWIAAEFTAYEALRAPLKAIVKARSICVPYWRAG